MNDAWIVDAVRTPVGRYGGALAGIRPDDLAAHVVRAVVSRSGAPADRIEEVYLGCANQAGEDNRNVARIAALLAGLPASVAGVTLNRLCASGLTAITHAARAIKVGEGEMLVAGGVESMSRAPFSLPKPDRPFPRGEWKAWDTTLGWRYPNPALAERFPLESMGETAENICDLGRGAYEPAPPEAVGLGEISRKEQDAFALESQRRAVDAIRAGRFRDEIAPVTVRGKRGEETIVDCDEHPRVRWRDGEPVLDTRPEQLWALPPAFRRGGTVTAGNSSGMNDGAAALLLASEAGAREYGLRPLARLVSSAAVGLSPRLMGLGPVEASRRALERARITMDDVDLIELNEAFAAQVIAVMRLAGMRPEITNVNGGAIALGHPLGCSGARLLTTLLHEMKRRHLAGGRVRFGLVTLCVGVGQGEAAVVEWVGGQDGGGL